ncbi:MAG: DUF5615 family PIN-like protein [Phycisphaerales bacterium]
MRLLFDENLSPRLVQLLADRFPDSAHVHEIGLGSSADAHIWQAATNGGFAIVSKDKDFYNRSLLRGHPPKVIWLRIGNAGTAMVAQLLERNHAEIESFDRDDRMGVLLVCTP